MTREQIAALIREEYDPKPPHWKAGEIGWDDGADAIAAKVAADYPVSQIRKGPFSYDPACEVLARHFLSDETVAVSAAPELAQHIQDAIEVWLESALSPHTEK